ncbi:MAG: uroporphyrinogen-III C-methyltransferase [Pseudomonadales bacterium]
MATPRLIWITRSQPGADRLGQRLREAGWQCLLAPVLQIEPVALEQPIPQVLDVAVALSEHAVAHAPAELWAQAEQIIAVGAQTARALALRGFAAEVPIAASSEGLLAGPLKDLLRPGLQLALVSGEGGRSVLQETLEAAGVSVFEAAVYRRVAVTAIAADLTQVAAIVVSSGDGFKAAGRLWFASSQRRDVPILAPSQRVADLAADIGFGGAINCGGADPDSVLAALTQERDGALAGISKAVSQESTRKQRMSDEQQKSTLDVEDSAARDEPEDSSAASEETTQEEAQAPLPEAPKDADSAAETESKSSSEPAAVAVKKPKSGRGLAFLSLLLALGAVAGAGYLYYELIYKQPFQQQLAKVDDALSSVSSQAQQESGALAQRFGAIEESFSQLRGEQSNNIDSALAQQQQRLEATEKSLMESLNRVANQAPPSQQEWKFAELEYLLRIANHRVLMEKDADGARRLLETADAILAELDDFGLHEVRAQLADEILSLKRLGKNDVQGLFLRLEAVKRGLDGLPLRVPEYLQNPPVGSADESGVAGTERGVLEAFAESMGSYLRFRELETQIKPLLPPEEITYLELNLRLMLEQAQLGALRGQTDVFEQSLDNAIEWLNSYLDADATAVADMIGELTALREISVARDLPDISGSLRALLSTERTAS